MVINNFRNKQMFFRVPTSFFIHFNTVGWVILGYLLTFSQMNGEWGNTVNGLAKTIVSFLKIQ